MQSDTSLTDNQTKPNQTTTTDKSVMDDQTKPNQIDTTDTSPGETIKNQTDTTDSSSIDQETKPKETNATDTSLNDNQTKPEKIEDMKEEGQKFHCELSDKEMVHKIALSLLEGLSTACVDMTTGDIFRSPGTVAADVRKEMLDYLTERSQSFVAESVILDGGAQEEKSDHPFDILSDFIDDFLAIKRSLLSRVSGWILSDMREDKIDDFVQEMTVNSFWLLDRREASAQTLLKNVDFKNEFHCNKMFKTEEELAQHILECGFRTVTCENEGCSATFSAAHLEEHDSICPFKILPCEQKCPEILMRREMDRHCITVCPMKLVNCPFYSIGCQAAVPSSNMKEHCSKDVRSHLVYALQYIYKGASAEDLEPRIEQVEQESGGRLAGMQGVRSFTNAVKGIDSRLGPFKIEKKPVENVEDAKTPDSSEKPANNEGDSKASDSSEKPANKEEDSKASEKSANKEEDSKTSDSSEKPANKEEDSKTSDSSEKPADNERDSKTSDSSEKPANNDRDPKTSDSSEKPTDKYEKDTKASDSSEHPAEREIDSKTSNSDEHPATKEKDTKSPYSSEHPAEKEIDSKTSNYGDNLAEEEKDPKPSGDRLVDREENAKTSSDINEQPNGKEKDAKTSDSSENSTEKKNDTSNSDFRENPIEKEKDENDKKTSGSGEYPPIEKEKDAKISDSDFESPTQYSGN